jgi:transcriptional regulator with XRE-family HTH domain
VTTSDLMQELVARHANFAANLRLLCGRQGSVSQVCSRIGINRQQFNKYLSGRHMPSPRNVRLIANHFGLATSILFADPDQFRALVDGNYFETFDRLRMSPQVTDFLNVATVEAKTIGDDLVGVYDRYHYSSIYSRKILRSAFCIFRNGDLLNHYYIERFPSRDNPLKTAYIFKYQGFSFPIQDRIFTVDFETAQRNEMTFGIFSAVRRSSKRFMFGIASGIAANMLRQPFATRVVLHYRHPGLLTRQDMEHSTALDMNDLSIPSEAREYLGDGPDMIKPT